jgi:hypothetical protein
VFHPTASAAVLAATVADPTLIVIPSVKTPRWAATPAASSEVMAVGLVVLGAVLGSGGAIAGSFLAGRHELTRAHRVRLYTEALPELTSELVVGSSISPGTVLNHAFAVQRAANVASRRDRLRAELIGKHTATFHDRSIQRAQVSSSADIQRLDREMEAARRAAIDAAASYYRWLGARFGGRR